MYCTGPRSCFKRPTKTTKAGARCSRGRKLPTNNCAAWQHAYWHTPDTRGTAKLQAAAARTTSYEWPIYLGPACKCLGLYFWAGKTLPDTAHLVSYLVRLMCCQTLRSVRQSKKKKIWVERTCLTRQVNVFMWKTGTERREMWKSKPAGNISPGKLVRGKYLHTDVTTHSRTKQQHTAKAFGARARKDRPLTWGNVCG